VNAFRVVLEVDEYTPKAKSEQSAVSVNNPQITGITRKTGERV
jgi:hypothetical protein